jgi:hypothetical protein
MSALTMLYSPPSRAQGPQTDRSEPPPAGFATWDDYWRDVGVPEAELGLGADCIIDPDGGGPRIWFQVVPESKMVKNRLHVPGSGRRQTVTRCPARGRLWRWLAFGAESSDRSLS